MSSPSENHSQSSDFFDHLAEGSTPEPTSFNTAFRGYDKGEVDAAIGALHKRLQQLEADAAQAQRSASEATQAARSGDQDRIAELEGELTAANAKLAEVEQQVATLTDELVDAPEQAEGSRVQFEAVLRVAEDQADAMIKNTALQAERLLESARAEVEAQRAELKADVARITAEAEHEADQIRLRIDTEYTAHEARIAREAAHAEERVTQAEQEAATIRAEADKGAAAMRSMVTRETQQQRADAEREVREMNARVLEFEESLTRRQNDAQQEFLTLHNQAVAHAERITSDANDQVAASLEHAQRISSKAEDYERMIRTQASSTEAEAQVRARETLDRAREKAQRIVDTVTGHTTDVLRDAEDRTRQLRWQQQQLNSFMAEVRELIRPDGVLGAEGALGGDDDAADDGDVVVESDGEEPDGAATSENDGEAGAEEPDVVEEPEAARTNG